jgi:SpoIID/LytB domain protein
MKSSVPTQRKRRRAARRALYGVVQLAAAAALSLVAAPSVSAHTTTPLAASGLAISGHGLGHGVGLSQWGAEERAAAGQGYRQILSFYYPGTVLKSSPAAGNVRVLVAERPGLRLASAAPFVARDAAGRVTRIAAGRYELGADGALGRMRLALPVHFEPGKAPLEVAGVPYRGELTVNAEGGVLQAIDMLPLEEYLVGVVSTENPGYWPQAALRAQAVASRTYALSHLRPDAAFDLYADDRSQNYHGLQKEFASAVAAVAATRHRVLFFHGRPIQAFFSASNGGLTSGAESVWGGPALPYLVSRPDPYDARCPARNWGPVDVNIDNLRTTFPGIPRGIAAVRVSRTTAERAAAVTFVGLDGSSYAVGGHAFQQRLGLRSTYITVTPKY